MEIDITTETYQKTKCRACDGILPDAFLELGAMPLANSFLHSDGPESEEFACPLSLTWCERCKLVQLTHVVPPEKMFSNYLYVSSTTKTFQEHFKRYAETVKRKLGPKGNLLAVDVGSNDGLLLSCYQKEGMRAVGVEPAQNLSREANQKNLPTINRFLDSACVDKIIRNYGRADAVSANNVFAHIDDVRAVCRNVHKLLNQNGLFVIEVPYLVTMFESMLFDMIYHEHLSYLSVTALKYIMDDQGFKVIDMEQVASHGGSLRMFCTKKAARYPVSSTIGAVLNDERAKGYLDRSIYEAFAKRVQDVRTTLIEYVRDICSRGKTISGYGAPAKANTIINYCGFRRTEIDFIVDDNPLKQDMFSPGARIPIVPSSFLDSHPTDYVIIFAWNFAREIMAKIQHLRKRGTQFLIPLPAPTIVSIP